MFEKHPTTNQQTKTTAHTQKKIKKKYYCTTNSKGQAQPPIQLLSKYI